MNLRKIIVLILIIIFVLFYFYLKRGDGAKKALFAAIKAVEKEDLPMVINAISREYSGQWGMNYNQVIESAKEAFRYMDRIKVLTKKLSIQKQEGSAIIDLEFKAIATIEGKRYYIAGDLNHTEMLTIFMRLEEGGWKIVKMEVAHPERYPIE